jgi:cell division protein FtsB
MPAWMTTRIRWDRIGRWALIGVFVGIVYLYVGPARSWLSSYAEAGERREDVAALQAEYRRLQARKRALSTPAALEREARGLGMVRAGERAYVVQGLPRD